MLDDKYHRSHLSACPAQAERRFLWLPIALFVGLVLCVALASLMLSVK